MTPIELAKKARDLIADPKHWTKNAFAKDRLGFAVETESAKAVRFCSIGAVSRATFELDSRYSYPNIDIVKTVKDALHDNMGNAVIKFNDNHTHEEVLAAWDRAIEQLEAMK